VGVLVPPRTQRRDLDLLAPLPHVAEHGRQALQDVHVGHNPTLHGCVCVEAPIQSLVGLFTPFTTQFRLLILVARLPQVAEHALQLPHLAQLGHGDTLHDCR